MDEKSIARFWAKVDKAGPAVTKKLGPCWDWVAFRLPGGYGRFRVGSRAEQAHRVSYALAFGSFDPSLDVLHRCDRPCCVNPDHLFLGTDADNTRDKIAKRRHDFGTRHARSIVNDAVVMEMRAANAAGESTCAIAKRLGLKQPMVYDAIVGRSWRHLPLANGRPMPPSTAERRRRAG